MSITINRATLARQVNGEIEYIYPKTYADLVEYDDNQNVKEKIDSIINDTENSLGNKVNKPLDGEGNLTNGNNGQVLISNGDGTTSWQNKTDIDKSLTVTDTAADAKATGDAIKQIKEDMTTELNDKVDKTLTINNKALNSNIKLNANDVGAVDASNVGVANGVAQLNDEGKIPENQLPSYVDEVIEVYVYEVEDEDGKPKINAYHDSTYQDVVTPENGKIYVDIGEINKSYRWSGSKYVEISPSIALGETSSTAYAGDKGKETTDKVNSIIDGSLEVVKYTNDMATVNALGGIAAGTTFDNMPISTLLTKLLYPYIAPTVSAKANPTNGGTFEKGTSVAVTSITATVTKKSEAITKVEVFNGSTSLGVKEDGATGALSFPVDLSVTANGTKFTAKVTDATGKQVSANTGTFTFVDPYYYGVMDLSGSVDETLVKGLTKSIQSKGNKTIAYTANNQKMVFAYPASYGNVSKIVDPNQFTVTDTFEKLEVNITCAHGASVKYYVYTSKNAVTVENYNMVFNY